MRFNRRGDLVAGVAGGTLSVNRQAVGIGGGPKWRTDDDFLANAFLDGQWALDRFDRPDWTQVTVNALGATRIGAGGGNYAASLASNPPVTYGEFRGQPLSPVLTALAVLDGAEDGGLLFVRRDGSAFVAVWADGAIETFPIGPHVNFDSVRMVPDEFLYLKEPRTLWLQVRGQLKRSIPVVDTPFEATTIIGPGDVRWFLYHNEATYLQREDEAYGYRFAPSFSPDVWVSDAGLCQVALTQSPGEAPDQIQIETFVLGEGAGPLLPPVPPIPPFKWPVYIAPFKDPLHLSGCPVSVENLGVICETADNLPHAIAQADAERRRVIFIWDQATAPVVPTGLRPWDLFGLECYRVKTETLDDSYRRWARMLVQAQAQWPYDLLEVAMFYGQGGAPPNELWTVPEILAANALLPQLLTNASRVKVVAPFAYDRLNGITAHPELQTRLDQYRAASPGTPALMPVPPKPVYASAGVLHMADDFHGVLNYFGTKDLSNGHVALYADAGHTTVWSAHGDTRPASQIGSWETWKLSGQAATAKVDAVYWDWIVIDVSGL